MIENANITLVLIICWLSILQKSNDRILLFGAFGFISLFSMMPADYIAAKDYSRYYLLGTIALVCVAEIVAHIKPITKSSIAIQFICLAGIITNFIGWLSWYNYSTHSLYNLLWLGVYLTALVTMLNRGMHDATSYRVFSWIDCFRSVHRSYRSHNLGDAQ